jgi:transposase InsO family protein
MPWQESTTMSLRLAFVQQASLPDANLSALCTQFGISRPTGYKWLARYRAGGLAALADRSRRPQTQPRQTAAAVEQRVLDLRAQHPQWGGRKLRARLHALEPTQPVPAASTVTAILRRHDQLDPAHAGKARAFQRFEQPAPNDLWQVDFKGWLSLTAAGGQCHPLTVLDDHSRFALGVIACADEQTATVQAALTALFRTYGLPWRLLCDNGSPWGSAGAPTRWTLLSVWLLRLGVVVGHGRPYHPQTQGKDERFHRSLTAEALTAPLRDLAQAQAVFDAWRQIYNHERPHEALQLAVPASRYVPSARPFPETLPPLQYDAVFAVRKVQQEGWISWGGHEYRVGKAFVGQSVGICPTDQDGCYAVYFADHPIASLDTRTRQAYPVP